MSTPNQNRPSFTCSLVRRWHALVGGARPSATGFGSSHLKTCAACKEFFSADQALEAALKKTAPRNAISPDGLDQRIIHALRQSQPEPRRASFRPVLLSLAGAAACVAIAAVMVSQKPTSTQNTAAGSPPPDVVEVMAVAESLTDRFWNVLKPSAAALAETNPLQTEIDSVYSDAESALAFLALNFLPSRTDGEAPGQEPGSLAPQQG